MQHLKNQHGITPLIMLLIAAVGILSFLVLSNAADFQGGIFKNLFAKRASFAADPGVAFTDGNGKQLTTITSSSVKLQLTSPWSVKSAAGYSFNLVPETFAQTASSLTLVTSTSANEDGSAIEINKTSMWLGTGASAGNSLSGLTFSAVRIPKGAKITSAKLQVYSTQNQWIGVNADITGDNVDNSASFSNSSKPSQRQMTSAKVAHASNAKWDKNRSYEFSDVTPIIQEIVNRSGWKSGNNLSLILKGTSGPYGRKFISGKGGNAPKLTITYSGGTGTPATPNPTAAPTTAPTITPTVAPTAVPTAVPQSYVVSAKVAEDGAFTKNVKDVNPFTTNPTLIDYTFSDSNLGTKMVYVKYVSSTGEEKTFSSSIELASVPMPSASGHHGAVNGESMAMRAWGPGSKNVPIPAYDKCDDGTDVVTAHNAYYVVAYDGIKYPTWHPAVVTNPITGSGKCYFGHEHGTDPQKYVSWNEMVQHFGKDLNGDGQISAMLIAADGKITPGDHAGIPFGIANEHMDAYYNKEGRDSLFVRHEDHVGHKIEIVNSEAETQGITTHSMAQLPGTVGINVPYYKSGSNTYQPTGVVCAHLHKFHQGTNSADAVRNNLHEVIFHSACQSVAIDGVNTPSLYPDNKVILTGMMAFGKPGEYKRFCFNSRSTVVCADGKNADGSCVINDPLISKLPDGINSTSLGRNMVDKYCFDNFQSLNPGINYFNPYEIWEGDLRIQKADGTELAQHGRQWDVLDPVRYIDSSLPNGIGFNQDRCNQNLPFSGNCARGVSGAAWNSPQAAFKGLVRTTYFGRNEVSNQNGAKIWWTDPLGGNAVTSEFASGLKQYIDPVVADIQRVQYRIQQVKGADHFLNDRAIQRTFSNGGNTVHAPN